jgi:DNA-binding protein H-NS
MAKTYSEMMEEVEALKREAERVRQQEVEGVIARIKEAIAFYGLTAADLGLAGARRGRPPTGSRKTAGRTGSKGAAAPKYRDQHGNTWSGRGPRPKWFKDALAAGRGPEDFAA